MISVKDLKFTYKKREILKGLNFSINSSISVLGENGSGKSTLLKCMLGLLDFKGEILLKGVSLKSLSRKEISSTIAYIPQIYSTPFDYKVIDMVLMARLGSKKILENYSKNDYEISENALKKLGILDFRDRVFTHLSGGERQLVYIARALASKAKVIFMDEPTNGLDFKNQIKLLEIIKELAKNGYIFIITTHHPRHAKFLDFNALMIKSGEIFMYGDAKILNDENISALYGIDYAKFRDIL